MTTYTHYIYGAGLFPTRFESREDAVKAIKEHCSSRGLDESQVTIRELPKASNG